jgi:hypothetical protein
VKISETYVNASRGEIIDSTHWYEARDTDRGSLFRSLQRQFGRCVSKVYRDTPRPDAAHSPSPAAPIADRRQHDTQAEGWVFSRREPYEDDRGQTYERQVWVTTRDPERAPEPRTRGRKR